MESVNKLIRELNRLDLDTIEYSDLLKRLRRGLLSRSRMFVHMSKSTERYFRARISNNEEINYVSQIIYPPKELVKGFQRCNAPKKPMFYTSSKRLTTLLECSAEVGDIIYLSQWMNKEPLPFNSILDEKMDEKIYASLSQDELSVLSYLDTIFTRRVHSSFSNQYKITAAITELITDKFPIDESLKITDNRKVGFVYPSIHDISGSYNTVFHPEYVEERMELQHIMKLEVKRKTNKEYKVKVIDNALNFEGGKIHWLNDKSKIPKLLESKSKVPFIFDGKKWNILVNETPLNNSIVNQMLNE